MRLKIFFLSATILLLVSSYHGESKHGVHSNEHMPCFYLGVLEHNGLGAYVRILFNYSHNEWQTICRNSDMTDKIEEKMDSISPQRWSVVYRNEILGQVKSSNPAKISPRAWSFSSLNLYEIESVRDTPRVGKMDKYFSGWSYRPVYHPLVVIPVGTALMPAFWDSIMLSETELQGLKRQYRAIVGDTLRICSFDKPESDSLIYYAYSDTDIIVNYSYLLQKQKMKLVSLQLNPKLNHCDGPPAEAWSTYWFCIDSMRNAYQIGQYHSKLKEYELLKLIDMGDFNNDGKVEALFWRERYNEDGYILFFDNFKKSVSCSWHYH